MTRGLPLLRALYGPLRVRRAADRTTIFQRTDDAMTLLVLLIAAPAQLGCVAGLSVLFERPLWWLALSPVLLMLFLRSGWSLRIQPGEVRARRVFLGLPMPRVTRLLRPLRLEQRCWEQDFGVFLPVVALVGEGGAEVELRVQPGQEERLTAALEAALARRDLPPATF